MIKVLRWEITTDANNVIVRQVKFTKDEEGIPRKIFVDVGYYTNLEHALAWLMQQCIHLGIGTGEIQNLKDILHYIKEMNVTLLKSVQDLNPETEPIVIDFSVGTEDKPVTKFKIKKRLSK